MADEGNRETIEIVYLAKADEAIANSEKMRSSINAIKVDIQNLATQSGQSFEIMAASMKKAFGSEQLAAIKDLRAKLALIKASELAPVEKATQGRAIRDEIDQRLAAWREYNQFVAKALAEINAAEGKFAKESVAREREKFNQKKELIKEEKDALAEYARAKVGDVPSLAAQAMGQEVQKVKAEIAALAAQNNKSFIPFSLFLNPLLFVFIKIEFR